MLLILPLLPSMSPTINLFSRTADNAAPDTTPQNGSPIPGTAVTNRPGHYSFDLTGIPNADYIVVSTNPLGTWYIRKTNTQVLVSESWSDLESTMVSISPQTFSITPNGVSGRNRLVFYNDGTQVVTIVRADGLEFDGTTMTFVIEKSDLSEIVTVSGLSSLTNTVTVEIPPTEYDATPNKKWSLRRTIDDSVVMFGPAIMEYVAIASLVISISTYFLPGSSYTYIRPLAGMYLR